MSAGLRAVKLHAAVGTAGSRDLLKQGIIDLKEAAAPAAIGTPELRIAITAIAAASLSP